MNSARFARWRRTIRHGLTMQRVIERLRRRGIDVDAFYLIREGVRPHPERWPELELEFPSSVVTRADVPLFAGPPHERKAEQLYQRLDHGDICVMVKDGDRVAGFSWANLEAVTYEGCDYQLKPGEAYLYDMFVAEPYRGRDLAPYLRTECYRHLCAAGRHTFYSVSERFNAPAVRFKQKLNGEFVRLHLQIRIGKRRFGPWILRDDL